jgi:hypothetical protein
MGVDLSLIPFFPSEGNATYSYCVLELNRRSELWPLVRSIPSQPVPAVFVTLLSPSAEDLDEFCGSWHEGNTQTDLNGEPLKCVSVGDLLSLREHPAIAEDWSNRAAWAYLEQVSRQCLVALYWW